MLLGDYKAIKKAEQSLRILPSSFYFILSALVTAD